MKILIVNIAWIDNGWQELDNKTISGHKHVKDGGIAHESVNFKFNGEWNTNNNIYGFCQFTNEPSVNGNDNIVVFYSDKKIVGVYTNVEFGKFKPENRPKEIEYFNMKANKVLSFKLNTYLNFSPKKYLPKGKQRIGQTGFTYIEQLQLLNILDDTCTLNSNLFINIQKIIKLLTLKDKDMNIWVIAPGEEASIWDDCKENGYIAIGWDKINIKDYSSSEGLKDALIKSYEGIETNTRKHNYLWNFGKNIQKSDIIIARKGKTKIIGIGEVISDYFSPQDEDNPRKDEEYKHVRKINWLDTSEYDISQKGEFAIQTVAKLNIYDERISSYIQNTLLKKQITEKTDLLEYQKQIILQGPPGTGKTRLAKQMANFIIKGKIDTNIDNITDQVKLIQFHPSYSYEDFVRGIVAKPNDDGNGIMYKAENKILVQMAKKAQDALSEEYYKAETSNERKNEILKEAKKYILIIDEINRANLSSVLGELIYALEYRDEAVESMYEVEENRKIVLPSNLYIIGTMNTADRSTGYIDYAIRRRFTFINILPDGDVVNSNSKFSGVQKLFKKEDGTKADTLSVEFNPDDVMLGHSYFIAENDEELENKFKYQVIPLLKEYIKDGILNETAKNEIEKL